MAYLPKSKYSIKYSSGGELVYKSNNNEYYIGDYIFTSNKKYYAGTNNVELGDELILKPIQTVEEVERIEIIDTNVTKHKILKAKIDKFLSETEVIPHEKPFPTDKDYEKGFFIRYFVKRINGEIYKEISKETFETLNKKKPKYDYNLYKAGNIIWHLTGNVFLKNTTSIKQKQKEKAFKNINLHFIRLDEYKLEENLLQTHLITNGGELYLANGKDYVGEYHIHESGPMVGPIHTEEPHERLYYVNRLPVPSNTSYEDFLRSTLPKGKPVNPKSSKINLVKKIEERANKFKPKKYIRPIKKKTLKMPANNFAKPTTNLNINNSKTTGRGPAAPSSGGSGY